MDEDPELGAAVLSDDRAEALLSRQSAELASVGAAGGLEALIAALAAPAQGGELSAKEATVQAFTAERHRQLAARPVPLRPRRATKIAAITTAVVVAFGGAAAAAVTIRALPGAPSTPSAHALTPGTAGGLGGTGGSAHGGATSTQASTGSPGGSTGGSGSAAPSPSGNGPDATGNAAYGLCHAYAANPARASSSSEAMRNLAAAAVAAGQTVAQYCAVILGQPPGKSSHVASPNPHTSKAATSGPAPSHPAHPSKPSATHTPPGQSKKSGQG
jgi:hypothetical protein